MSRTSTGLVLRLRVMSLGMVLAGISLYVLPDPVSRQAQALDSQPVVTQAYQNTLTLLADAPPLLNDYPQFVAPIRERIRYEAPAIVNDPQADLEVRAWRFSYNARGIIEMPNHLRASATAVIMVHPWGIDDGQGWRTPEPAGVCDFCTPDKNHLAAEHTRQVIDPLLKALRPHVQFVMFSLPGDEDPIRKQVYRSVHQTPTAEQRTIGARQLHAALHEFDYRGEPLPATFALSTKTPVIDYFQQFPGLDAGARYNHEGFWKLPIPVTKDITLFPNDVVIYDAQGYAPLRDFLLRNGVRHVILTGYATDMCFCKTTAGYDNLAQDFNVFLVGDATLATFPSNDTPRYATNAAISFAALNHLITQVSWIKVSPQSSLGGTGK